MSWKYDVDHAESNYLIIPKFEEKYILSQHPWVEGFISIFYPTWFFQELFAAALDFLKLEKIEVGGSRGKVLSEMVFSMSEEFHDCWRTIRESKYDPLDYTNDVRPGVIAAAVSDITLLCN